MTPPSPARGEHPGLPVACVVADANGILVAANESAVDWTGRRTDQLVGTALLDLFGGADRARLTEQLLHPLEREGTASLGEAGLLDADGRPRPVLVSASRTRGTGRDAAMDCIVFTPLPAADREQPGRGDGTPRDTRGGTHEAMLRAVLDTVGVGVAVLDDRGRPVPRNALFESLLDHAAPGSTDPLREPGPPTPGPHAAAPVPPARRALSREAAGESFTDEPGPHQSGVPAAPDGTPAANPRDAWTRSYRRGLEAPAIAKLHRAPLDTVRRHLAALLAAEPLLWERRLLHHDHPAPPWEVRAGRASAWRDWHRRLEDFTARHGSLPRAFRDGGDAPSGEAPLRLWLEAQRAAHRNGELTLTRHTLMARIPGWNAGGATTPALLRRKW